MKKLYVNSPCGHGKLADVIPYDGWSGATPDEIKERHAAGHWRWGLMSVVMLDRSKPGEAPNAEAVPCCSHAEGDYKTRAEAEKACAVSKKYHEDRLRDALAVLDGATREVWALAAITLSDLFVLREHLAGDNPKAVCSEPLCFEQGCAMWLVEEELEACLCEEHLKGKKILTFKGTEVVFESWEQINKLEGLVKA